MLKKTEPLTTTSFVVPGEVFETTVDGHDDDEFEDISVNAPGDIIHNLRIGKRQASLKYSLNVNGRRIDVCRTFFLNTLSISQTPIRFALAKRQPSGIVTSDQRGKHEPGNKIGREIRNRIREHIQKFPCIESYYSRNKSKRKYLGSYLNISQMYRLFYEECLGNQIPTEEIPKEWLYREIFNSEFNLSFKEPGNDTCDICDEFIIKLKRASFQNERN